VFQTARCQPGDLESSSAPRSLSLFHQ
jgi:hypothetical protein